MRSLGKLGLIIADPDEEYVGGLENYLRRHYAARFDVRCFTDACSLERFLAGCGGRADILLAGREFLSGGPPGKSAGTVIALDDGRAEAGGGRIRAVNRYQHAERLVTAIFGIYSEVNAAASLPAEKSGPVATCFISPGGGAGKSLISAGCSLLCARRGIKTFYLNLEDVPSTGLFFEGESEYNFSNVIYYLKSKDVNLAMKLAGAKCTDAFNGVHFFLPPESLTELSCLQPPDLIKLMDGLRQSGACDAVFVDMPGELDGRTIAVMKACDRIVCIYGPDISSAHKLPRLQKELELIGKRLAPGLGEKIIYAGNDARGPGHGNDLLSRAEAVFGACGALRSTGGRIGLQDCGADFTVSLGRLLEKINPDWTPRRHGQAGGDDPGG